MVEQGNNAEEAAAIQRESIEVLFRNSSAAPVAHYFCAFLVFLLLPDRVSPILCWSWLGAVLLLSGLRHHLLLSRSKHRVFEATDLRDARIFSTLSAATWGLLPVLMQYNPRIGEESFVLFVLAGLAAGGVASQAADKVSAVLFSMFCLLPGTIFCLIPVGGNFYSVAVMAFAYIAFLSKTATLLNKSIVQGILLRIDKENPLETLATQTAELARQNVDLSEARQAAESASRAKSDFLTRISHELRTPLNGVLGMTEIALELAKSPEQLECLKVSRDSGHLLLELINDILDLSAIESGHMNLKFEDFDLIKELKRMESLFSTLASSKQLVLTFTYPEKARLGVRGDRGRITQVLTNMLGNAIKFTNEGTIQLHCELNEDSKGWYSVRFSVSDTGIGIPESQRKRIFEVFEQVDTSNSRKFGGTGLGLSISRHLAQLMEGDLQLINSSAKGSTFCFELELEKSELKPEDLTRQTYLNGEVDADSIGNEQFSILVVEDNKVNQVVAQKILESAGYQVTIADNGAKALDQFHNEKFQLILMDCQMPVLDGLEATKRIRELESEQNLHPIPIVALTAHAFDQERENCMEVGMDDFLAKPYKSAQLIEIVKKFS